MKPGPRPRPLEERFLLKVKKTETCWFWIGARATFDGYGAIRFEGKNMSAHRASYILYKGPIPPGMQVCHTCDLPPCVNPDHLFLGTRSDNMQDKVKKGRARTGYLPPEVWSEIRREAWAKILPERRKEIVEQRKKLLPEQWSEINQQIWAERSEEDRKRIAEKNSLKQKGRKFTPEHLANLRASPANQEGRQVRHVPERKLPLKEIPRILERYNAGATQEELANEFSVSHSVIGKVVAIFGVKHEAGYGTGKQSEIHDHGNIGAVRSEEQKQAHAQHMAELWASRTPEERQQWTDAQLSAREIQPKPEPKPPLTSEQLSEARKKMWKERTPEQRAQISQKVAAANLGKKLSPEHIEKLRLAKLGKRAALSDEAKARKNAAIKARHAMTTPEQRAARAAKIAAAQKDRAFTPEHLANLRAAHQLRARGLK